MKHAVLYILFSLVIDQHLFCQTKKICITVDDLPVVSYDVQDTSYLKKVTKGLIEAANKNNVPLIGYVNEGGLYTNGTVDSFKVALLKYWITNGHDLGNHTYSHIDYNNVTIEIYTADIIKGEAITRTLLKEYNKQIMYFRHPYLHTGSTKALSDELHQRLDSLKYIESPVTIDNADYVFAYAYHQAFVKKDQAKMKYIGKEYIRYMERKLLHFENISDTLCDRYIGQTLLLHANLLNAYYLNALISMYKRHNYIFVSQTEILKDEVYTRRVQWYTRKGESWLYRWSPKEDVSNLKKDDPEVPEAISK